MPSGKDTTTESILSDDFPKNHHKRLRDDISHSPQILQELLFPAWCGIQFILPRSGSTSTTNTCWVTLTIDLTSFCLEFVFFFSTTVLTELESYKNVSCFTHARYTISISCYYLSRFFGAMNFPSFTMSQILKTNSVNSLLFKKCHTAILRGLGGCHEVKKSDVCNFKKGQESYPRSWLFWSISTAPTRHCRNCPFGS